MDRKALTGILASLLAAIGCGGGSDDTATTDPTTDTGTAITDSVVDTATVDDTKSADDTSTPPSDVATDAPAEAAADTAPKDFCGSALFCENFDSYSAVSTITGGQKFGPWSAELKTGATMKLDGVHNARARTRCTSTSTRA